MSGNGLAGLGIAVGVAASSVILGKNILFPKKGLENVSKGVEILLLDGFCIQLLNSWRVYVEKKAYRRSLKPKNRSRS